MDASSVAAAALAVAADHSRAAALSELLLERERLAMREEDLRSFVAARHFTRSLLTPPALGAAWTWERAYAQRHNDLVSARDVMRAALDDLRQGDAELAEQRLSEEVGEEEKEEEEEDD